MTILEFIEKYKNIIPNSLKEEFIKNNLHIKTYVPYLTKITLADKLVKISTLDEETGNIKVKSEVQYLLFCRMIIEQYTDLKVETEGFFEEYDLLNESGVLDKIMQMIPEKEIAEFQMIVDMKKKDLMTNLGTPQAFINQQIERISNIFGITLKPVLEKISDQIENLDEKDIEKLGKTMDKVFKRIK